MSETNWPCCGQPISPDSRQTLRILEADMVDFRHDERCIRHDGCGRIVIVRKNTRRLSSVLLCPVDPALLPIADGCPICGRAFTDEEIRKFKAYLSHYAAYVSNLHGDMQHPHELLIVGKDGEPALVAGLQLDFS